MITFVSDLPDEIVSQALDLKDTHNFKLKEAREKLKTEDLRDSILPYSYRPFDNRCICYRKELIDRDRYDVMKNFFRDNLGLVVDRTTSNIFFSHVFVSDKFIDVRILPDYGGAPFLFPLYLYHKKDNPKKRSFGTVFMIFEPQAEYVAKKPNLSPELIEKLTKEFKKVPTPEQIFYYIYAVLYSNIYREKYAEFLKIDFPRVPFTKDYKLFSKMADYGKKLVELHLLKSTEIDKPVARFQGKGDNRVEKPKYDEEAGLVYINKTQYFEGISSDVWTYQIGGYQVCEKWLKDRKKRILSLDETQIYCRIVTAIQKTIEIQKVIDTLYEKVEQETPN